LRELTAVADFRDAAFLPGSELPLTTWGVGIAISN